MKRILKILRDGFIWIAIIPIRVYQYLISPLLPMSCRHAPTCSQYAIEALKVHGMFRGTYLAVHRILRCHPWGTHGYDPVPPKPYRVFKFNSPDEKVHTDEINQVDIKNTEDKDNSYA